MLSYVQIYSGPWVGDHPINVFTIILYSIKSGYSNFLILYLVNMWVIVVYIEVNSTPICRFFAIKLPWIWFCREPYRNTTSRCFRGGFMMWGCWLLFNIIFNGVGWGRAYWVGARTHIPNLNLKRLGCVKKYSDPDKNSYTDKVRYEDSENLGPDVIG